MTSASPLTYLHLITAPLLLVPLAHLLLPRAAQPIELPGVRPITVRKVYPRRALILACLVLLSLTGVADAALAALDVAWIRQHHYRGKSLNLAAALVYAIGGFVIWAAAALVVIWREKWGSKGLVVLGTLGLVCEVPNLVFLILREVHKHGNNLYAILAIPPSALRILLFLVLLAAVSNPRISFEPAEETTGLLSEDANGDTAAREAYGTFDQPTNPTDPAQAKPTDNANAEGEASGPPKKPNMKPIPKKLGEGKKKDEKDEKFKWSELGPRLKKIAPHLWPSQSRRLQLHVLGCIVMVLLERVANPVMPLALGQFVRALVQHQGDGQLRSIIKPFAVYFSTRLLFGGYTSPTELLRTILWMAVEQNTDREMSTMLFHHLLWLSLSFHTKRNTGEVQQIIARGSAVNNLLSTILFRLVPTVLDMFISIGVFYWLYGLWLTVVIYMIMILYAYLQVSRSKTLRPLRQDRNDKATRERGIYQDALTNWESIKYFTAENRENDRYRDALVESQVASRRLDILWELFWLAQGYLMILASVIGTLVIATRVLNGQADAASYVIFQSYLSQLTYPVSALTYQWKTFTDNMTDADKMFKLLDEKSDIKDQPDAKDIVITDGVIEFRNVSFAYDDKKTAIDNVSFTIGKGQSLALVGQTGSGKSTILRLLYRFYDPSEGQILVDGQDIAKVTQLSLRQAIGIVPQDSVLWNDTIGANIAYGKVDAEDEDIIEAATAAQLHDKIMTMPDEYGTIVGERGVRLSGGEKQRVSLARMFVKNPTILLLDEATSALDTETEREIQRALQRLSEGKTSLSIAHRLSTIVNSDIIVVMKDGKIVERGSYKQLLKEKGIFASMWKKQVFSEAELLEEANPNINLEDIAAAIPVLGSSKATTLAGDSKIASPTSEHPPLIDVDDSAATDPVAKAASIKSAKSGGSDKPQKPDAPPPSEPNQEQGYFVDRPVTEDVSYADAARVEPSSYAETVRPRAPTPEETEPIDEDEEEVDERSPLVIPTPPMSPTPRPGPSESVPTFEPGQLPFPRKSSDARAVAFPTSTPPGVMPIPPRLPHSTSQMSGMSVASSGGDAEHGETPDGKDKDKADKRRKRLSSIKGFVRRISDQGGVKRSHSFGGKGTASPLNTPESEQVEGGQSGPRQSGESSPAKPQSQTPGQGQSGSRPETPAEAQKEKKKKRLSLRKAS